ncbi:MAG: sensor histidine kinase [Caulobacteraceae bacterium]|nr:sensor histidine kinase [Caulobacteraceae bacterium]
MFGSSSLRLAAFYTAGFAMAVAILGLVTIFATRAALIEQFDARIRTESTAVKVDYQTGGAPGMIGEINERRNTPGELSFGAQTADGRPLAGPLARLRRPAGWSTVRLGGAHPTVLRVLTEELPGGYRLMVGDDIERVVDLQQSVLKGFALALGAVVAVGVACGFALSRAVQRRMSAISGTAEAIIDGDLARRIPVGAGDDDLARLAHTINRMLDRIAALMDSLRQVSNNIAHDLRTPLTRLRQRLELSLRQAEDPVHRTQTEGALRDVDAILATFSALLRIAEVEAGARRSAFRREDLTALARTVVEDFAPAAEDAGHSLALDGDRPAWIEGDPELITQMMVNLIENALRHTPPGSDIAVRVTASGEGVVLAVIDDGPGVPEAERERLFGRFYRLEHSRSTPGSGLGLALVSAVAWLHRAEVKLLDARPGLEVRVTFPPA